MCTSASPTLTSGLSTRPITTPRSGARMSSWASRPKSGWEVARLVEEAEGVHRRHEHERAGEAVRLDALEDLADDDRPDQLIAVDRAAHPEARAGPDAADDDHRDRHHLLVEERRDRDLEAQAAPGRGRHAGDHERRVVVARFRQGQPLALSRLRAMHPPIMRPRPTIYVPMIMNCTYGMPGSLTPSAETRRNS